MALLCNDASNWLGANLESALTWWRHRMGTFSALLVLCTGNSPVTGEFPSQRPVTRSFDVFFDLRPNKRLSKQSWNWWFETLSWTLWRHSNEMFLSFSASRTAGPCLDNINGQCAVDALVTKHAYGHMCTLGYKGEIIVYVDNQLICPWEMW